MLTSADRFKRRGHKQAARLHVGKGNFVISTSSLSQSLDRLVSSIDNERTFEKLDARAVELSRLAATVSAEVESALHNAFDATEPSAA
jgi:hypothetical protein